jgi:DNA-binding response OmpR family regulator
MIKRVLLVEDDALIRLWLADDLLDAGFDVVEAEDGDRAIVLMDQAVVFDLLITDISMPGRADGNAVAIWAKQRYPGLPVIYASGRPASLTNSLGLRDAFVPKPFSGTTIRGIARRLLDAVRDQAGAVAAIAG